jgi:glycosyltransferase involved in cell wall biosynthesis
MVSVAVLVELVRSSTAGGHVKCWERFAEAAARLPDLDLDLTVYFLGGLERVEVLSPRVRFVMLPPVLSTAALTSAEGAEDISDLAPFHPRLAALLHRHQVWHLTHCFAYTATADRIARRAARGNQGGRPRVVGSVHTDVPALASVYTRYLADRAARGPLGSRVPDRMAGRAADRVGTWMRRRRDRLLRGCELVLAPTPEGCEELSRTLGADRVSLLRRGIDHERFRPDGTARAWLGREYGVPTDRPLVLFAGRLDASKRVPLLAESLRLLRERGRSAHTVMVGSGAEAGAVRRALGADVTLLGALPQERLARVYAGCDILGFPSRTETCGNVVAEAMASGLAVVLPEGARTTRWLAAPGEDGVVVRSDEVGGWADALSALVDRPRLLGAVRRRAAATARDTHPSWGRVLAEDLLPVWLPAALPTWPEETRVA